MRVFLAIDIPPAIKKKIARLTESIRNYYPHYNWVSEENYHITVYFFGEVDENMVSKIKSKIKNEIWDVKPFYLYSKSIGVFSNKKHVLYIDFYREKELENLVGKIKRSFSDKNKNKTQYIPHLTLARGKRSSKQQYFALIKKLKKVDIKISLYIDKIVFYQSIITSSKPIYKPLCQFNLT